MPVATWVHRAHFNVQTFWGLRVIYLVAVVSTGAQSNTNNPPGKSCFHKSLCTDVKGRCEINLFYKFCVSHVVTLKFTGPVYFSS